MSEPSSSRGKKVAAPRGRGRRSQAERDQILQAEKERTKAREVEYAREQAAKTAAEKRKQELDRTSRANRRLGRGGYMGDKSTSTPSGPFSAGSVFQPAAKVGKAYLRPPAPSKRPSLGSRVKVENDSQAEIPSGLQLNFSDIIDDGINLKSEDGGYISSDPDEAGEGARKDVDFINLISDDEYEEEDGDRRLNSPALVPVRIQRVEHKRRALHVNSEASSTMQEYDSEGDDLVETIPQKVSRKAKQRTKDTETPPTQRIWKGVYEDEDEDEDDIEIQEDDRETQPPISAPKPPHSEKTKRKPRPFDESTIFQTEEDRQEHARRERQLAVLRDELGAPGAHSDPQDQKAERVYVFQFPAQLPELADAAGVKAEPSPAAAPGNAAAAGPIKIEDDGPGPLSRASMFAPGRALLRAAAPPGRVGALRVHRSGRVTLDWGGTSLLVGKGLDESTLQDVVVVRPRRERGVEGEDGAAAAEGPGEALALGQVRGKFVVTPDWDELWG